MAAPAMDEKKEFELCLELLRRVVAARGKDPDEIAEEYVWPARESAHTPTSAVSLAPLLTGGGQAQAPGVPGGSVVPVPPGIEPPES